MQKESQWLRVASVEEKEVKRHATGSHSYCAYESVQCNFAVRNSPLQKSRLRVPLLTRYPMVSLDFSN